MRLTPDKKLHSREHVLAEDLSQALGEPKRFAAYLGLAMRYHESDLRALSRYVLEKKDLPLEARGKYFFASIKGLIKKPAAKQTVRTPAKKKIRRSAERKQHKKEALYGGKNRTKQKHNGDRQGTGKSSPKKSS